MVMCIEDFGPETVSEPEARNSRQGKRSEGLLKADLWLRRPELKISEENKFSSGCSFSVKSRLPKFCLVKLKKLQKVSKIETMFPSL